MQLRHRIPFLLIEAAIISKVISISFPVQTLVACWDVEARAQLDVPCVTQEAALPSEPEE